MRRVVLIGSALGLCVCIACVAIGAIFVFGLLKLTAPVAEAGDDFLNAAKAGDYAAAYEMCSTSLQDELGGVENLQTYFAQNAPQPTEWSYSSRNITNDTGSLGGTLTLADGTKKNLDLQLIKEGDEWKISGVTIN